MQLNPTAMTAALLVFALVPTGACSSDEADENDAGAAAGGTPSGGTPSGGTPSGGTPSGGTPSGGTPSGGTPSGGAEPDADVPDAAAPDATVIDCPPDVVVTSVDVNAHPDGPGFRYVGDTTGATDATSSPCGGAGSPDVLHRFVAPAAGNWRIDTESTEPKWDTLISVRATCQDAEAITCNDDAAFPPLSQVTTPLEAGEVLYIIVDGHAGGANPDRGAYVLSVTPR
jgi:hypothetical protein